MPVATEKLWRVMGGCLQRVATRPGMHRGRIRLALDALARSAQRDGQEGAGAARRYWIEGKPLLETATFICMISDISCQRG